MYNTFLILGGLLAFSLLVSALLSKTTRVSTVVGYLLSGMLISLVLPESELMGKISEHISLLSQLGLIFLLFLAGWEVDMEKMKRVGKEAMITALSATVFPFLLGFAVGMALGYSPLVSFLIGAAMAVTSEGTKIAVLLEYNVLKTRLGAIMVGASVADDLFEILFLALTLSFIHSSSTLPLSSLFSDILLFALLLFLIVKTLPNILHYVDSEAFLFALASVVALIISGVSEELGLGPALGAFLGGMVLKNMTEGTHYERVLVETLKNVTFGLVVPFFFIKTGLSFSWSSLTSTPSLFPLILGAAVAGKFLGVFLVKPLLRISWKQALLLGLSMNSRGAMELVVISLALSHHLLPRDVYSSLVLMTLVTTLAFPVLFGPLVRRDPHIMD